MNDIDKLIRTKAADDFKSELDKAFRPVKILVGQYLANESATSANQDLIRICAEIEASGVEQVQDRAIVEFVSAVETYKTAKANHERQKQLQTLDQNAGRPPGGPTVLQRPVTRQP